MNAKKPPFFHKRIHGQVLLFLVLIFVPYSKSFAHNKCSRALFDVSISVDEVERLEELHHSSLVKLSNSVFALQGSQISEVEVSSLEQFVSRFDGHALAIGNFAERKGTPVIDAVYFPADSRGQALNISIKTSNNRDRTNGIEFIKREVAETRKAIAEHYSKAYFRSWFGVDDHEGTPVAAKGRSYKNQRLSDYQNFAELLGLEQERPRKIMVILDLSSEITQSATIETADHFPELLLQYPIQANELILRIHDSRVDNSKIEKPRLLNLTYLQRKIQEEEANGLGGYYILLPNQTVILTASTILLR